MPVAALVRYLPEAHDEQMVEDVPLYFPAGQLQMELSDKSSGGFV